MQLPENIRTISRRPDEGKRRNSPCIFQVVASLPTKACYLILALPAQTVQDYITEEIQRQRWSTSRDLYKIVYIGMQYFIAMTIMGTIRMFGFDSWNIPCFLLNFTKHCRFSPRVVELRQ
jgi:hypothetical protein